MRCYTFEQFGRSSVTSTAGCEDVSMAHEHQNHLQEHRHPSHAPAPGPLADASVRVARETDAPAVGLVQAEVWREAYAAVVPEQVLAAFEPSAFAKAWRSSLASPPHGVYRLLAACAGEQVVGFAAIGPSQDPDASALTGELSALGVHPGPVGAATAHDCSTPRWTPCAVPAPTRCTPGCWPATRARAPSWCRRACRRTAPGATGWSPRRRHCPRGPAGRQDRRRAAGTGGAATAVRRWTC